jgi:protein phosphatase
MRELHNDPTIASNLIYNCLGGGAPDAFADLTDITDRIFGDDRFIICSDGLSDMLTDEEIESVVKQALENGKEDNIAVELAEAAKSAGGRDNVSVLMLYIIED